MAKNIDTMDINALNIDESAKLNVKAWLEGDYDEATKQAIREMAANPQELNESFYRHLEFGTGGLRGIMGVGTNRMNRYTVAMATQGLANYVKKVVSSEQVAGSELRAAVSHDSRNHSREFAEITANVLAANGFKVFLFDGMRPTPELSFAVRHFHCHTGVMVTASHNPKEYNGYKAYWSDGCQLTAPHDEAVIEEVLKIKSVGDVKMSGGEKNIQIIGEEVDKVYLERVEKNSLKKLTVENPRSFQPSTVFLYLSTNGALSSPVVDVPDFNVIIRGIALCLIIHFQFFSDNSFCLGFKHTS